MMKKVTALVLAATMMVVSFTGCGNSEFNGSEVVAKVGETEVTADVANFYARYQQAYYESYYSQFMGENMWAESTEEGVSYEKAIKEEVLEALKTLYVLKEYADDYNVSLTEDEKASIKSAASSFVEANESADLELISGSEEVVTEVLELITIQQKMRAKMVADVNKKVSDDEANQKKAQYVYFSFQTADENGVAVTLDDEEKDALINDAKALIDGGKKAADFEKYAKDNGYEVSTLTFDSKTTAPSEALVKAADELGEGEFADVVVEDTGCYVVKLVSLLDKEATEAMREEIIAEREETAYSELCAEWKEEIGVEVNDDVWEKIDFQRVGVTVKGLSTETENTEE